MRPHDLQLLFTEHSHLDGCEHHAYNHIEFIIPRHFPKTLNIDGSQKINIHYGSAIPERGWYLPKSFGSISEIHFSQFDFTRIENASLGERELVATELIRDGLLFLCKHLELETEPIEEACRRTIEDGFTYCWTHKKTSKSTKDRRLRIETHMKMGADGVATEFVFFRSKQEINRICYPLEWLYESIWFDLWNVEWRGCSAIITDRIGSVIRSFTVHESNEVEQVVPAKSDRVGG